MWHQVLQAKRSLVLISVLIYSMACFVDQAGQAEVLQGSIQETDAMTRLNRQASENGNVQGVGSPPTRIGMPVAAPNFRSGQPLAGLLDTAAFTPLRGNLAADNGRLGLLKPQEFGNIPNSKFDLGAERGDRELVVAWEAWHHQLSSAVYRRWSEMANTPGQATMRITVTRERQIIPTMLRSSGSPRFDRALLDAVMSLNGNPGLTFPAQSRRQEVSFEADYLAATDIRPGFSWVKNDYEKVHDSY